MVLELYYRSAITTLALISASVSVDRLIQLTGEWLKGLEQHSIISEQE